MRIYHGTSYEFGQNIISHGFQPVMHTWDVSMEDCIYFYYPKYIDEEEAREYAIENAQITAALNHSNSPHLFLFSIEIDESMIDDFLDYSCENMSDYALEIPIEFLKHQKIEYEKVVGRFFPSLSLAYLAPLNKDYLNTTKLSVQEEELLYNPAMCEALGDVYMNLIGG